MAESSLVGMTFDKYEIQSMLGKGGMATVYLGVQTSVNRPVAVKVLPAALLHDSNFMERFKREAEVIARLEHFHILPVYDYGEFEGMPYLVMRYLDGGTVEDHLEEGPLAWADIIRITGQVAQALDYAHGRGVIHRDLKPSNILLDEAGNAYLGDFGIAKVAEGTANLTGSGIVGTPAYMAPEQSESGTPTPAMDIYALGCTVFEMLTGHVPFAADTPIAQILMHIQKPIPSIYEYYPDAPFELQQFLETAMAKVPEDRYPTCRALADGLEQALMLGSGDMNARPTMASASAPTMATPGAAPYKSTEPGTPIGGRIQAPAVPAKRRSRLPIGLIVAGGVVGFLILAAVIGVIILTSGGGNGGAAAAESTQPGATVPAGEVADQTQSPVDQATEEVPVVEATDEPTQEPTPTVEPTAEPSPTPLPDRTFVRGVPMLLMPAGGFSMGKEDEGSYPRERPAHSVNLDAYYIDETEVTNVYYRACVDEGGCAYPEFTQLSIWPDYFTSERFDNFPVAFISWPEAQNYCRWRGGYLPTEAQWEKAARYNPATGEETTLFPWGELAPDLLYANFGNNLGQKPEESTENPDGASPIGAVNMAGNMLEWVFDWYDPNYYEQSPTNNPLGPETGAEKVVRGGYWNDSGRELTVTWRYGVGPGFKQDYIGFRCAYTPPPGVDPTLNYGEQPTPTP